MIFWKRRRPVPPVPEAGLPPLWLDEAGAAERIRRSGRSEWLQQAAEDVRRDGLTVLRGVHEPALCEQVIADYERYVAAHRGYVDENRDALGHEKRLVNFHHESSAAMRIGVAPRMMELFDFLFGYEAGVYTSLTFRYGTQQPVHRDTPHFATWPRRYFCGYWTALRDVRPDAGPLFYYRGAHTTPLEAAPFAQEARRRRPTAGRAEQLALALDLYNGEVIRRAAEWGEHVVPELQQGDVVVWHADTPHGGSPAADPEAERWSIVFHCAPKVVQVHQHDAFFGHDGASPPADRYGFGAVEGRAVANAGGVAFM